MDEERIALMCRALGDSTRLHIFNFLRSCCCPVAVGDAGEVRPVAGPTVGEVCCHITGADRITSTISHHIKELRLAGLVTVERRGKNMICGVNHKAVEALVAFLDGPDREVMDCDTKCCD